jgi:hypothetical protein
MPGKHYGKKSKKLKLGGFMKKAAPMLGGAAGMLLGKKKGGKMSYMKAGGPIEQFD